MESSLTFLEGSRSGARYDADVLQRVDPIDGAPLLARYDLNRAARTLTPRSLTERHGPGMWRWRELLPVRDPAHRVHLGEGSTPLLRARRLGPALGADRLLVKAEGVNPTGSFKARGMAAAVSRARELGAKSLIAPSAGNAGGALAAYGAAAGMPVTVVMPADTPEANIAEAQICGAEVVLIDGFISDCGRVAKAIAARTGAFNVATLAEPYRVEGKKTMGLELVENLGWAVPDVVVYPTGGGTGLIGMWKAFDELESMGLLGVGRPRMVSVQAEGCAPIVEAFHSGAETATPWPDPATRASGLRVPSALGDRLILQALRQSEGTAIAVPESEIDALQRLAGRRGAGYVSPETAAAFAAVAALADDGWLSASDRVVVFDTGIGHKYPPPALPRPAVHPIDVADDPDALARPRGGRSVRSGSAPTAPQATPAAPRATPAAPQATPAAPSPPSSAVSPSPVANPVRPASAGPPRGPSASRLATLIRQRVAERTAATPEAAPSKPEPAPETIAESPAETVEPDVAPAPDAVTAPVDPPVAPSPSSPLGHARPAALDPGPPHVPGEARTVRPPARPAPRVPGAGDPAPRTSTPRTLDPVTGGTPGGVVGSELVAPLVSDTSTVPPLRERAPAVGRELVAGESGRATIEPPKRPVDPNDTSETTTSAKSAGVPPLPKPPHREIVVRPLPAPPRASSSQPGPER